MGKWVEVNPAELEETAPPTEEKFDGKWVEVAPAEWEDMPSNPPSSGFFSEFAKGAKRMGLRSIGSFINLPARHGYALPTMPVLAPPPSLTGAPMAIPKGVLKFYEKQPEMFRQAREEINKEAEKWFEIAEEPQLVADVSTIRGRIGGILGEVLPFTGAAIASSFVAGPAGPFAVAYTIEGGDAYRDAKKKGATDEQATIEGDIVGLANAALESLQISRILKFAKGGSLRGLARAAKSFALKEMVKEGIGISGQLLKLGIENAVQEALQEGTAIITPAILRSDYPKKPDGSPDIWAMGQRVGQAAFGGGIAGMFYGGLGSVITAPPIATSISEKVPAPEVVAERPVAPSLITEEHRQLFRQAAEQAKGVVPIVEAEISRARGRIAGEMRPKIMSMQEQGVPTEDAIKRSIPPGPLTEYTQRFPSIREQLGREASEAYFATIPKNPAFVGREYQMKHTQEAFTKLLDGSYLTLNEVAGLDKHFGKFAPEVVELARTRVLMGDKVWQTVRQIANIPYTTLTSVLDMSGLFRQGRLLAQRYPHLAPEFAANYAQSFWSEESAQRIMDEISTNPNMERAVRIGKLELTELPSFYEDVAAVEETKIASPLLERIPILGKYFIRPTSRSFTAALNWYRMSIVDRAMSAADRAGKPLTSKQLKRLCADVNDLSGRSTLPKALRRIAPFINMLFAPRFTISRIKVLGRTAYRPNVALSMASLIGTNMLIMGLVKMLWPDDVEIEPDLRAADGGKIKVGDMRIDLWAGELPIIRSIMRLATGETKTSTGRYVPVDYRREIFNIFRARGSPGASLLIDAWMGNTYIGEQFGAPPRGEWGKQLTKWQIPKWIQGLGKEAWNRLGPLTMQDTTDTFIEEGLPMAITATFLSGSGIGVQAYPEMPNVTVAKLKDAYGKLYFDKKWDDLGSIEQKVLRQKYKEIRDAEQAVKVQRHEQPIERIDIKEQRKTHREIYKKLNADMRASLDQYGISIGLSRKIGDWWMNDERYERYKYLVTKGLNGLNINRITTSNLPDEQKQKMVQLMVDTVKKVARQRMIVEAYPQRQRQ